MSILSDIFWFLGQISEKLQRREKVLAFVEKNIIINVSEIQKKRGIDYEYAQKVLSTCI